MDEFYRAEHYYRFDPTAAWIGPFESWEEALEDIQSRVTCTQDLRVLVETKLEHINWKEKVREIIIRGPQCTGQ